MIMLYVCNIYENYYLSCILKREISQLLIIECKIMLDPFLLTFFYKKCVIGKFFEWT